MSGGNLLGTRALPGEYGKVGIFWETEPGKCFHIVRDAYTVGIDGFWETDSGMCSRIARCAYTVGIGFFWETDSGQCLWIERSAYTVGIFFRDTGDGKCYG